MRALHNILGSVLALILLNSTAIAAPGSSLDPCGSGSSAGLGITGAADCTVLTGGAIGDLCNDTTGAGSGIWYCSTATCEGAGWLRSDDDQTFRGAMVYMTSDQDIVVSTPTVISWDAETYDVGAWYDSAGDTFFTVPAGVSRVKVCGAIFWEAQDEGWRSIRFFKNAAAVWGGAGLVMAGSDTSLASNASVCSAALVVTAGDVITMVVEQDNNGDANAFADASSTKTWFSIAEIH